MDSPIGITQPWTPPETEADGSQRSDYFSDPFRRQRANYSADTEHHWRDHLDEPPNIGARCDTPTEDHRSRPKPIATLTDPAPYTPTKTFALGDAHSTGALRYPYTPDSSRILRRSTELPSSPTPWDDYLEHSSPVQNALSSCIAHFENLIQTRQPDEDQMEYIVGQFETMASFLSAPEAQSKTTDEHLFSEPEHGLGITSSEAVDVAGVDSGVETAKVNEAYVTEVGRYIESVKKYIEDLKMRLDEVRTLNSIQLDVIYDLRRQMKTVRQGMRSSLDMREEVQKADDSLEREELEKDDALGEKEFGVESWETLVNEDQPSSWRDHVDQSEELQRKPGIHLPEDLTSLPIRRVITIVRKPKRRSFWASFGEALDAFGDLMLDY